jgi:hypothetical protein
MIFELPIFIEKPRNQVLARPILLYVAEAVVASIRYEFARLASLKQIVGDISLFDHGQYVLHALIDL